MENKIIKMVVFATLFLVGSLTTNVFSQNHLDKWAEKCENVEGVNYTLISKKDRVTKEPMSKMISISFKNNPTLKAELLDAALKDKKDAIEIIENKKDGVLVPQIYKFYDNIKKVESQYIFGISKSGTVSLVINGK